MKDDPEPLPWEKIPAEYKRQLYQIVPKDFLYLLGIDAGDLGWMVKCIREGRGEVRRLFIGKDSSLAVAWLREQREEALDCFAFDSPYDDSKLCWSFRGRKSHISPVGSDLMAPDGAPANEARWTPWINWHVACYFFQHEVEGLDVLKGERGMLWIEIDGLFLLDSMPEDLDTIEKVVRLAKELTAPDAEGRERFRLNSYKADGPNINGPLVKEIWQFVSLSDATIRRYLIKGGWEHPADLTWVLKRLRPGG